MLYLYIESEKGSDYMAITNKQVEEFESKYKKILFDKIHEFSSANTDLRLLIEKSSQYIGTISDLPNISTTLNNKLVELSRTFQEAGTSIYSTKIEDYGPAKLNIISTSLIGEAIIFDMLDMTQEATNALGEYQSDLKPMVNARSQQIQSLQKNGPLKNFFLKLRGMIFPDKKIDLSYTPEEIEKLNSHLSKYTEIDENLWQYNLEDNLVPSLVKHIQNIAARPGSDLKSHIPEFLEQSVVPDLQKLGLMHLLPQLQQELSKQQDKEAERFEPQNSWELSPEKRLELQQEARALAEKYVNPEDLQNPENLKKIIAQNEKSDQSTR